MVSCASKPPNARDTYFQQSRPLLKPSEPRRTLKTLASVPVSLSLFARSRWTPASGSASAGGAKRLQLRLLLPLLLSLPQLLPLLIATMHVRSFSSLNSVSQCSMACRNICLSWHVSCYDKRPIALLSLVPIPIHDVLRHAGIYVVIPAH